MHLIQEAKLLKKSYYFKSQKHYREQNTYTNVLEYLFILNESGKNCIISTTRIEISNLFVSANGTTGYKHSFKTFRVQFENFQILITDSFPFDIYVRFIAHRLTLYSCIQHFYTGARTRLQNTQYGVNKVNEI